MTTSTPVFHRKPTTTKLTKSPHVEMPIAGAAMEQKMRVSANWPTTVEPRRRIHRDFSPVRRLMAVSDHALSSCPTR